MSGERFWVIWLATHPTLRENGISHDFRFCLKIKIIDITEFLLDDKNESTLYYVHLSKLSVRNNFDEINNFDHSLCQTSACQ